MGAHESLEHSEHIIGHGHDDHHKASNKLIGLTIALIGVLLAFCAAMVASERNELTRAMIEQTQAHSDYSSASTKFRLVMLEVEKIRANPQGETTVRRFLRLYLDYSQEKNLSKAWVDTFQPVINAHFDASEDYEKAQLLAEIGIVIASMAVLLHNRKAWFISLILASLCVGQLGRTWVHQHGQVGALNAKVEKAGEAYAELRKVHSGSNEDEKTVEILDPGGKIRAEIGHAVESSEAPKGH